MARVPVPASMRLLGDRNWWLPAPLRRLHDRIGLVEQEQPANRHTAEAAAELNQLTDRIPNGF